MNISIKNISIILFTLSLIAGCGNKAENEDLQTETQTAEEEARLQKEYDARVTAAGKIVDEAEKPEYCKEHVDADGCQKGAGYQWTAPTTPTLADVAEQAADQKQQSDKAQRENNMQYLTVFACTDAHGAGRNDSLAELLLKEYSNPNGAYAAYMSTSAISSICSSMNSPFTNMTLLREKGNRKYSGQGAVLYLVKLNPNTTIGVLGRE